MQTPRRALVVSIHDVSPLTRDVAAHMLDDLSRGGSRPNAAPGDSQSPQNGADQGGCRLLRVAEGSGATTRGRLARLLSYASRKASEDGGSPRLRSIIPLVKGNFTICPKTRRCAGLKRRSSTLPRPVCLQEASLRRRGSWEMKLRPQSGRQDLITRRVLGASRISSPRGKLPRKALSGASAPDGAGC